MVLAPGIDARAITLRLDGYAPARQAITRNQGPRVVVPLARAEMEPVVLHGTHSSAHHAQPGVRAALPSLPASEPDQAPEPAKPAPAKPDAPKPRENLIKGDFVDPFSEGK